jgi:hypothetical protein
MNVVKIPVVIGRNRLRGKGEGAMVFDDFGQGNLETLQGLMRMEARLQGIDPDAEWLSRSVRQMLALYEEAYREWQEDQGGCIGFIYECGMPSGQTILFGDRVLLERVKLTEEDSGRLVRWIGLPGNPQDQGLHIRNRRWVHRRKGRDLR